MRLAKPLLAHGLGWHLVLQVEKPHLKKYKNTDLASLWGVFIFSWAVPHSHVLCVGGLSQSETFTSPLWGS